MTDKPRIYVTFEPDVYSQLLAYGEKHYIQSKSETAQELVRMGLGSIYGEKELPATNDDGHREWESRLRSLSPSDLRLFGQVLQGLEDKPEEMRAVLDLALRAVRPVPQTP